MYITCIQGMVERHISAVKKTDLCNRGSGKDKAQWNWDVTDANAGLLKDIQTLTQRISSCETALACGSWVVRELPIGIFSAPEPKAQVHYCDHALFVLRPSVFRRR